MNHMEQQLWELSLLVGKIETHLWPAGEGREPRMQSALPIMPEIPPQEMNVLHIWPL